MRNDAIENEFYEAWKCRARQRAYLEVDWVRVR